MALETASFINALNPSNPTTVDPISQGDDHIRLIKSALKATFPNLTGAVTPSHTVLNYLGTVTSDVQAQVNTKAPLASPALTGTPTAPTAATPTNTTQIASTAFVQALVATLDLTYFDIAVPAAKINFLSGVTSEVQAQINAKAPLASPALTGTPTAPTATAGNDTTALATTAFVKTAIEGNRLGVGIGQSWGDYKASRAKDTAYMNWTGKPIAISIICDVGGGTADTNIYVGGVLVDRHYGNSDSGYGLTFTLSAIVPNGVGYSISGNVGSIISWAELR